MVYIIIDVQLREDGDQPKHVAGIKYITRLCTIIGRLVGFNYKKSITLAE
jgi:hypothetical protein